MTRLLLLTLPWLAALALFVAVQPERDSLAGLQPFPSRLKTEIHDIRDKAAEVRELSVNQNIEEGFITEADMVSLFAETIAGLGEDFQASLKSRTEAMRLMHLIGPGDDLETLVGSTEGTSGLAGFYFPTKKSLLVVGEFKSVGRLQEFVLAHEYIHSFQDQAFNLEKVFVPGRTPFTESAVTGQCIAEGDATLGAQEYMKEVHGPNWQRRLVTETLLSQASVTPQPNTTRTPTSGTGTIGLVRYVLFTYSDCANFITAVRDRDGWEGVNALYSRLPDTTEQILHPEKYFSRESAKPVSHADLTPALNPNWKQESSEAFGELDLLAYMFGLARNDASSRIAADGWGGGAMSVYGNPVSSGAGDTLVHITIVWDSPEEMAQFRTEYQRALSRTLLGSRQTDLTSPEWNWQVNWREQGHVRWNTQQSQADIILSTSDSAIAVARTLLAPPPAPTIAQ